MLTGKRTLHKKRGIRAFLQNVLSLSISISCSHSHTLQLMDETAQNYFTFVSTLYQLFYSCVYTSERRVLFTGIGQMLLSIHSLLTM